MKYHVNVMLIVNLINSVLLNLQQRTLLENTLFEVNEEKHVYDYFEVRLKKENAVRVHFVISSDGFNISIDRADEAYSWSIDYIKNNYEGFENFLKVFFTSEIIVEYCGKHFTKIYFLDEQGTQLQSLKYTTSLLFFKRDCTIKKYLPIFPTE